MIGIKKKSKAGKVALALILSVCLSMGMLPSLAKADDGRAGATTWKEIYGNLGVDTSTGYDAVTSATQFKSGHAAEGSGAAGIPACISRAKDGEGNTLSLDGAVIPDGELKDINLGRASHKTFEQAAPNKKYGTDEFIIEPDWTVENWSWNAYFDTVYAVTVSDGTKTVGAVPWIDFYGQKGGDKGTSGQGHYNYVEVALNNGAIPTQPTMSVNRFASFYDDNNELKSGKYTVTVYSTEYKPLKAENIWVPKRANAKVTAEAVTDSSARLDFEAALPSDFDPEYKVDGKTATIEGDVLSFDEVKPGTHNIVISSKNVNTDGEKKYGDVNASFVYSTDKAVAEYDSSSKKLVGIKDALYTLDDYINAITTVNVNGKDYAATGRRAVKVIGNDGTIDLSKTDVADTKEAVNITIKAAGYPDLSFEHKTTDQDDNGGTQGGDTPSDNPNNGKNNGQNNGKNNGQNNGKNNGQNNITKPGDKKSVQPTVAKAGKKAQKMTVKTVKKVVKAKKLKKKKLVISKVFRIKNAIGKIKYKAAGKSKRLSVNAKNGKITVKKMTNKGTYKIKVKVTAAGNAGYKAASKTVTVTISVK